MKTILKKIWKFFCCILDIILGIVYYPIYLLCLVLHIVARFLLAVAYAGLFDGQRAKNTFKSLFRYGDF